MSQRRSATWCAGIRCSDVSRVPESNRLTRFSNCLGVQNRCQKHLEIAATTEGTGWTPSSMERVGGRIFSQALASCARSQTRPWVLRRRRRLRRRVRLLIITFRADASILLRDFDELGNDSHGLAKGGIYQLCEKHFRPRGYKLKVQIADFPGGLPRLQRSVPHPPARRAVPVCRHGARRHSLLRLTGL